MELKMKRYKVLSTMVVFCIETTEYIGKKGDTLELPEDHITTQALVYRKQIEEEAKTAPAPKETDKTSDKPSKK
jgi:hypothetical protein